MLGYDDVSFRRWLRKTGKSEATINSYASSLRLYFDSHAWTWLDACRWKEEEMSHVKPATLNLRIYAINRYAEFMKTKWRLKPIKVQPQQFVEHQLTMAHYNKLLEGLMKDGELRWWTVIKVMACTGVRISEALQIRREDLVAGHVDIIGKGSKVRRIWFSASLRREVLSTFKEEGPLLTYDQGVIRKRLHAFAKRYGIPQF